MNKPLVFLTFFCAVISLSSCGYSDDYYSSSGDSYFNLRSLGYSHGGAGSNQPKYFTNSLDYSPGVSQQQYQYPVYQQDDLKKPPEYIPVIENGVPKDTPEVQRAKDEHFALFKKLAEAAANAPENEGQEEEELGHGKSIYQKYQRVQPKINYAPQSNTRQHFTEVFYPKYAPAPVQPQPQPQPQQYHQPAPVSAPVRHQQRPQHAAPLQPQHGIFIVGPDEPREVQQARADHLAAHKDVLAYIKHSRKNQVRQQPKYYSAPEPQVQSYTPQSYSSPSVNYGGQHENIYR